MDLMEYMAKELFDRYGIPTMKGFTVDDVSAGNLAGSAEGLKFPLVVKAQVQTGGRGKAGGVRIAENIGQLPGICGDIIGMNIKGHIVRKLLVVEKADIGKEWYISIMLDRFAKCPMVIFSPIGGMDIEETAKTAPDKVLKAAIDPVVGLNDYLSRYLLSKSGLGMEYFEQLSDLIKKLYKLFCDFDCLLVEINPLVVSAGTGSESGSGAKTGGNGDRLVAVDGKITVDDSALYRQPDILAFRDSLAEDRLVLEARKFNFLYIPCEAGGSIGIMSNGSGMIMSCIDLISKQGMKVGAALDLGGGATADRIREAIRIILSNETIKALFINIFGGITRCDEVASGVKLAMDGLPEGKLVIVRFEGTNKEKGLEILGSIRGNVVSVDGLREGVKELDARRTQL